MTSKRWQKHKPWTTDLTTLNEDLFIRRYHNENEKISDILWEDLQYI